MFSYQNVSFSWTLLKIMTPQQDDRPVVMVFIVILLFKNLQKQQLLSRCKFGELLLMTKCRQI